MAAWATEHNVTFSALPALFWRRVATEVAPTLRPAAIGVWEGREGDQVDVASLPPGSFVNVWSDRSTVARMLAAGVPTIYSGSFYLDQNAPGGCAVYARQETWSCLYSADPAPPGWEDGTDDPLLLGGEAAMWGEGVNAATIEGVLWPRAAAAAERFWSSATVNNVTEAAPRLTDHACRLSLRGFAASPVDSSYCPADLRSQSAPKARRRR